MIKILQRKNLPIRMKKMNSNLKHTINLVFFWIIFFCYAQENIKHTVVKGETITSISEKYNVTPSEVYNLNPEVLNGLQENIILIIPKKTSLLTNNQKNLNTHLVKEGETIYSLSKKYNISKEALEKANPEIVNGLKLDQKLIIPIENEIKNTKIENINESKNNQLISIEKNIHIIQSKETLYGISKKYNISQEELIAMNPELKNSFPLGFSIKLKKNNLIKTSNNTDLSIEKNIKHKVLEGETLYGISKKYQVSTAEIIKLNPTIENGLNVDTIINIPNKLETKVNENISKTITEKPAETPKKENVLENVKTHKVVSGETLYSISNKYNLSQEELINLNPSIKDGLQIDTVLKLKQENTFNTEPKIIETKSNVIKTNQILTNTLSKNAKEITILIPFNIENQDIKSEEFSKKLKKDAFLNLALEFYSGAMIAIDSLKKLNLNLKFNILDSNESKNSSNIATYTNKLKQSDVIIGPFYQNNAEETAKLFPDVPVISPLSKENSNPIKNLYQTMPSGDFVKIKTFEYLSNKNAQIIAMIDKNKNSTKALIKSNYKKIALIPINEKGAFVSDSITYFLKKDKINYIVIETSSTSFLLNTLNTINTIKSKGYNTQLVILDMNKIYESEEIFPKIYKQDFFYPSVSKANETASGKRFNKIYKQRHSSNASVYAIRGFDVVFDTATRIAQEDTFENISQSAITNQLEYKFDYQKNPLGSGYVNNGIYFLKYSKDMKIVEMEE
jgi:LysM repeat protein